MPKQRKKPDQQKKVDGSSKGSAAVTSERVPPRREEHRNVRSIQARMIPSWVYAIAPVVLAVAASINTLWNGWVADDYTQVLTSAPIKSLANIPLSFVTSVWSYASSDAVLTVDTYYRPVFMTLFTLNYAVVGLAPWAWHLINVLIHAGVTFLVFALIVEMTTRRDLASVSAALFAVHPAHAESVAWVSGITDPLMALFFIPAFICYIRFHKTGYKREFIFTALLYTVALFGKETAIALPPLIAYCELFHFKEDGPFFARLQRAIVLPALLIPSSLFYLAMRYIGLRGALFGSGQRFPLSGALMTLPLAVTKYIKLLVLPWGHSYQHYTEFVGSPLSRGFLLPLAIVLILTGFFVWLRSRIVTFGAVWFFLLLAPALAGIQQFDPEYLLQDRYLYLPSIGFCLVVGCGLIWLSSRIGWKATAATASILILGYGAWNVIQNAKWKNNVTIFEDCVSHDPTSPEAHLSIGRILFEAGRVREGEDHCLRALELGPNMASPYLMLSYFSKSTGKLDKSIEYLERGVATVPVTGITRFKVASMYLNMGLLKSQSKGGDDGERDILRSIEIWPRATGWINAGEFYLARRRYDEALSMFEKASVHVPPRYSMIHLRLGQSYDGAGRPDEARVEYRRFLELAPDSPDCAKVKQRLAVL